MYIVNSKNNIPIRLTEERWFHITEEHSEMAGYFFEVLEVIEDPIAIYEGKAGECIAVKEVERGKYIVVVYKESKDDDGFVITAFLTRRKEWFERRRKIWPL
ncbi:MAG: PBECR2 nuclease fold domain-containing protein [bacterium]